MSAKTGEGLDELRAALARIAASVERARADAPTRLYVDRSFSIAGFGTVVTGTLWSGSIGSRRPAPARAFGPRRARPQRPGARRGRRSRGAGTAGRGQPSRRRARRRVSRRGARRAGCVPDLVSPRRDASTRSSRSRTTRDSCVHVGTAHVPARVVRVGSRFAQLRLDAPVVAARGDRVILRGETTRRRRQRARPRAPPAPRRRAAWSSSRVATSRRRCTRRFASESLRHVLDGEPHGVERAGPWVFSSAWLAELEADIRRPHRGRRPDRPGRPAPAEAWAPDVVPLLPFERRGSRLYLPGRSATLDGRAAEAAALEAELLASAGVRATKVEDDELARFLESERAPRAARRRLRHRRGRVRGRDGRRS